ncbi:MAG: SDR family oxidoreductase [Alphaproteobacteria bacterium]|nr:SDR family oxidoreductase [Alphaproteobacteria bacterium]
MKDVVVLIGAGLIGQAIVRRVGYGRHLVVGDLAAFLMSDKAAFITGADFLIDGGTTASYWYGDLQYMRDTMGK